MPVSDGNSKLGKIPNWSLVPVADCPNCSACKSECYALKAWRQYANVRKAWGANSQAVRSGDVSWIAEVDKYLARKRPALFRIHVAGDFVSRKYAEEWAIIAQNHPGTRFLAFTKAFAEVDGIDWPDNFTLVRSAFPGMDVPESGPIAFAGEACEYEGDMQKRAAAAIMCPGKCDGCGVCWDLGRRGMDVRFPLH